MASWQRLRYRRSRHLVGYWVGPDFLIHNYATGTIVHADPALCQILDLCDDWRSGRFLIEQLPDRTTALLRLTLGRLVRRTLLHRSDHPLQEGEAVMNTLGAWNPHVGFFHASTKNVSYIHPLAGDRALRRQARTSPPPAIVKRHPRAERLVLPKPSVVGELPDVLLSRRTWRTFSPKPVEPAALGTLLGLTGGIQHRVTVPGQGEFALKTSPSGGARHPIELYVLALRVAGVPRGLYHYRADTHELELLMRRGRVDVERYLPTQHWFGGAGAVVFLSAVFRRMLWKYSYARAYRAAFIEAGHLCQTFCLVATWLGLAPFCSMALADSRIERDLGLDGVSESVLYCAGVGTRPASTRPMMVDGRRPFSIRPNVRVRGV